MKKLALTLAIVLGLSMTTFAEGGAAVSSKEATPRTKKKAPNHLVWLLLACLTMVAMKTLTPPSALASPC